MNPHNYIACFLSGMLIANAVPHFVHGISGDRFPTPFAKPPGKGLSSPTLNVVWALGHLFVGYGLFWVGGGSSKDLWTSAVFLAGIAVVSVRLSVRFAEKHTE